MYIQCKFCFPNSAYAVSDDLPKKLKQLVMVFGHMKLYKVRLVKMCIQDKSCFLDTDNGNNVCHMMESAQIVPENVVVFCGDDICQKMMTAQIVPENVVVFCGEDICQKMMTGHIMPENFLVMAGGGWGEYRIGRSFAYASARGFCDEGEARGAAACRHRRAETDDIEVRFFSPSSICFWFLCDREKADRVGGYIHQRGA